MVAMAGAACLAGCEMGPVPLDIWAAGDMTPLTNRTLRASEALVYDALVNTVTLSAAANEIVAFQLVLDAGQPLGNIRVEFNDLLSASGRSFPAESIRAFRMRPTTVESYPPWYLRLAEQTPQPATFYDVLIPAGSPRTGSFDIPAGGRAAFWIDVHVPADASPGVYRGAVRVRAGALASYLSLKLTVYDFALPRRDAIPAMGGVDCRDILAATGSSADQAYALARLDPSDPQVRRGLDAVRQIMLLAREHRLELFDHAIRPELTRGPLDDLQIDWSDYDAVIGPYLDARALPGGAGATAWPMPIADGWPPPPFAGIQSPRHLDALTELAHHCREHFDASHGSTNTFYWPQRNPAPGAYEEFATVSDALRRGDPRTPILTGLPAHPLAGPPAPPDFARQYDIAAPPGEFFSADQRPANPVASPLSGLWLTAGPQPYVPSLDLLAAPADVRALPWLARRYGCSAVFIPDVLHWSEAGGDDANCPRLFRPAPAGSGPGVLATVQIKRLRRGMQDLAYLQLLDDARRTPFATAMVDSLVRYAGADAAGDNPLDPRLGGWVREGSVWVRARWIIADELELAGAAREFSPEELLDRELRRRRFEEEMHAIRVEQIRTRLLSADAAGLAEPPRLQAAASVEIYSELDRPETVALLLGELPPNWLVLEDADSVAGLTPESRHTLTLSAEGPPPPTDAMGHYPLRMRLGVGENQPRAVTAPLSYLRAGVVREAPLIDGRLDDWPLRAGNTAGDFQLLGLRGGSENPLARRQTLAFILRDERNLYVALRCSEENLAGMAFRPDNRIRREQLMAVGEDLVEVLFDPAHAAADPSELYHLIVKPNGVLTARRGVWTDPPLGPVESWAASAVIATGRQDDAWIVEMAIPLSAFGEHGSAGLWGVNFMRFATQGNEASSWAAGPRYFYHPHSLGTMYLPPAGS